MPGIPTSTYHRLRDTLLTCDPFDSSETLRAIFVDNRLYPWMASLPEAESRSNRVDAVIAFLLDKYNVKGENALVIFLRVLGEEIHPQDARYRRLLSLADELEEASSMSEVSIIESSSDPSKALESISLDFQQRQELIQVLLESSVMADRSIRDAIVADLPSDLSHSIRRSTEPRIDVNNIISSCLRYAKGLDALIEIVRFYEGDSLPMQKILTLYRRITAGSKQLVSEFDSIWVQLTESARSEKDKARFTEFAGTLANGLLREAIGYSVEMPLPYYKGIVGYKVNAPTLWIRHSRFPLFFIAYNQLHPDILDNVVTQMQLANTTEYFAILIVIAAQEQGGNGAEALRRALNDSVYRHDFVVLDKELLASIITQGGAERLIEITLEQGIPLTSLSPYVTKGPVPEDMFFGREEEIKAISQTVGHSSYAIIGGRRIGKSSILLRLNRMLGQDPRYFVTYLNCEEKLNYEDLLGVLADEFNVIFDISNPLSLRKLMRTFREKYPASRIVLFLDEIDALLNFDSESQGQLFKTFRALSHEGVCRFVFSGSKLVYQHLHASNSPFFNFCEVVSLKPLNPRSVVEIINKPMRQLGIALPEDRSLDDRIIEVTSCHPNLVQWICDQLVRKVNVRRKYIALEDLEALLAGPEFGRYYLETAWGDATPLEKATSLLVEKSPFGIEDVVEAAVKYGFQDKVALHKALEILQLYALIERWGKQYRFVLLQFPRIVREVEDVPFLIESLLTQSAMEA
jgi:hypothetical protein